MESQKERMEMRELNDDEILHIEAAREMMDKMVSQGRADGQGHFTLTGKSRSS